MTTEPLNRAGYPQELFNLPEEFIEDPGLRLLHAEVCARLLSDQPDADMLDVMIIERTTTAYFYVRQKELAGSDALHPATYKNIIRMWLELATELRKKRLESFSELEVKEKIVGAVVGALNESIYGLDPVIAKTVRDRMVLALDSV